MLFASLGGCAARPRARGWDRRLCGGGTAPAPPARPARAPPPPQSPPGSQPRHVALRADLTAAATVLVPTLCLVWVCVVPPAAAAQARVSPGGARWLTRVQRYVTRRCIADTFERARPQPITTFLCKRPRRAVSGKHSPFRTRSLVELGRHCSRVMILIMSWPSDRDTSTS